MPVSFTSLVKSSYPANYFKRIINRSLQELGVRNNKEISLVLVGKKRMSQLNRKYRGKNEASTVLSFVFKTNDKGSCFYGEEDNFIGEIFICPAKAKEEAKERGINLGDELKLLTIHALLHLLGYNHKTRKQRELMEGIEKRLIKAVS